MLRVGIVGVGFAGRARARALAGRDDARLVAVHRGRFAADTGVPEVDADVLLAAVDVVVVSSPSETHADWVRRALEARRHVIVEYPLARTADEGRALLALAARVDRVLHVEHIERLAPTTRWMADIVAGCPGWTRSEVSFVAPGLAEDAATHAWQQLARVSRVVAVHGWPTAIHVDRADGVAIDARLVLDDGRVVGLAARRATGAARALSWTVEGDGHRYVVEEGRAVADGVPVALPAVPLFATDLDVAVGRIRGTHGPYLDDAAVIALLELTAELGRPGFRRLHGNRRDRA
jgi:hypothetical protein